MVSVTVQDAPEGSLSNVFEPHGPFPVPVIANELSSTVALMVALLKVHTTLKETEVG